MKKLLTRTLVGAAYVAVMVAGTVLRPWTLLLLVMLLTALAVEELVSIISEGMNLTIRRTVLASSAMFFPVATYCACTYPTVNEFLLYSPYVASLICFFTNELHQGDSNPIGNLGLLTLAQVYVVLPLSLLLVLGLGSNSAQHAGEPFWLFPLATYIFLWLDDTGAFIFGSWLGKHKLAPRISPGKTWEGVVGGCVLALVAAVALWRLFPFFDLVKWLGMALVVAVFGTLGDLTESLIKRQLGLKDSGKLLPGHGGILDRIDSMLLAVPAVSIYLAVVGVV